MREAFFLQVIIKDERSTVQYMLVQYCAKNAHVLPSYFGTWQTLRGWQGLQPPVAKVEHPRQRSPSKFQDGDSSNGCWGGGNLSAAKLGKCFGAGYKVNQLPWLLVICADNNYTLCNNVPVCLLLLLVNC